MQAYQGTGNCKINKRIIKNIDLELKKGNKKLNIQRKSIIGSIMGDINKLFLQNLEPKGPDELGSERKEKTSRNGNT